MHLFQSKLGNHNVLSIPDAYVPSIEVMFKSLKIDLLFA